jgi:probable rRNA maturation factor
MEIEFINSKFVSKKEIQDFEKRLRKIIKNKKLKGYLSVNFVSKNKIKQINKKYLNKNQATDVLSFSSAKPSSKKEIFGDIVISPEIAKKEKITIFELVKHGLLHLAGYDHETSLAKWKKAEKDLNKMEGN